MKRDILMILIIGVVAIGGYFAYTQFKDYQDEQEEKEAVSRALIAEQQKVLEETQQQVAELRREGEKTSSAIEEAAKLAQKTQANFENEQAQSQEKTQELEQKLQQAIENATSSSLPISSGIAPSLFFMRSVSQIICQNYYDYTNGIESYTFGSGSIWWSKNNYWVLTNEHVLENQHKCFTIVTLDWNASVENSEEAMKNNKLLIYELDMDYFFTDRASEDMAAAILKQYSVTSQPLTLLGEIALLPDQDTCTKTFISGTEIKIFGYPGIGNDAVVTVTEGILSSFEMDGGALYYLTSAKIDEGSSGGLAFVDLDANTTCVVGIPTYVQIGAAESLGRILSTTRNNIIFFAFTMKLSARELENIYSQLPFLIG